MSNNIGTAAVEEPFLASANHSSIDAAIVDSYIGNVSNQEGATSYGNTRKTTSDQAKSLFDQQLILLKDFESPCDIRYKTDYFPVGGKNAGKPQPPRYVHTVDGEQNITIKFAAGYRIPENLDNHFLEVALITVPRINQHYLHVNKFQLSNEDVNVSDENPFFIPLTTEHIKDGEIAFKLVIVKTPKRDLKNIQSLPLFDSDTNLDKMLDCETTDELQHMYELSQAKIAFSLGYTDENDRFIRYTKTTVTSNDIVEKEKSKGSGMDFFMNKC
ncbi:unnamed protein product [Adineta steineri]|uniref:Uncharacterized protein n=1 Tax=Adineta steineri TaxID=433720 RepID=A0A814BXL9_9BILA|nr:unnamed protein product [Adineta steineri]